MSYKLLSLTPMLESKDVKATMEFYTASLGFTVNKFSDELGWLHLSKDDISIMFSLPNKHRNIPEPIMSGSLYFNTENVDTLWNEMKDRCKVCYPIESFDYCMREFAVYDNNGYLLQFGQNIENEK